MRYKHQKIKVKWETPSPIVQDLHGKLVKMCRQRNTTSFTEELTFLWNPDH